MKKNIIITFMIIVCFIFQCTFFRYFEFNGISPNLLVILTSAFGFMRGKRSGTLIGFFSGLLIDIFFGHVLGFYALIYMYIGFTNGAFRNIFFPEDIKLPLFLIAVSDISYCLITYLLTFLLRGRFSFDYYFVHIILPEIVYTIMATVVVYPIILFVNRRFEAAEKRSVQNFV